MIRESKEADRDRKREKLKKQNKREAVRIAAHGRGARTKGGEPKEKGRKQLTTGLDRKTSLEQRTNKMNGLLQDLNAFCRQYRTGHRPTILGTHPSSAIIAEVE